MVKLKEKEIRCEVSLNEMREEIKRIIKEKANLTISMGRISFNSHPLDLMVFEIRDLKDREFELLNKHLKYEDGDTLDFTNKILNLIFGIKEGQGFFNKYYSQISSSNEYYYVGMDYKTYTKYVVKQETEGER